MPLEYISGEKTPIDLLAKDQNFMQKYEMIGEPWMLNLQTDDFCLRLVVIYEL